MATELPRVYLSGTGLEVAVLGLGTGGWGWWCAAETCEHVMDAYWEAGGNLIDCADVYPLDENPSHRGLAEEIIGAWMARRGNRERLVVATKLGGAMGEGASQKGLGRRHVLNAIDGSLKRLRTDYVDLYQAHWDDGTDLEETLRAMEDLVKAGKVRHIGGCSYSASRLRECMDTAARFDLPPFRTLQVKVNLLDRDRLTPELSSVCEAYGVSLLAYSPLASGFLTGRYQEPAGQGRSPRSALVERRYRTDENLRLLRRIAISCERAGVGMIEFCLGWVLRQPGVSVALVGASSVEQLAVMAAAATASSITSPDTSRALESLLDAGM